MRKPLLFLAILLSGFLISCGSKSSNAEDQISLPKIEKQLESNQLIARTEPITLRQLDFHLNGKWIGNAVSYGCYREGQAPGGTGPSQTEILEDLNIISEYWNLIRVYNSDDDTERILEVIRENDLPLKLMLGVWLANETDDPDTKNSNIRNALRCIELTRKYSEIIIAVNVGNETQVFWSWHKMNSADLVRYIRMIRNHTSIPVTTADDYNFWNKSQSKVIADEVDFIVTHIYPLWNGKTLDNAMEWLDKTYREIQQVHPQKQIVLGEIGWATQYNEAKKGPNEQGTLIKGEVSLDAQYKFLIQLDDWITDNGVPTFLFEAFDEPWKGGGEETEPNEIEKNWGVFYADREAKESFQNYLIYKKQSQTQ